MNNVKAAEEKKKKFRFKPPKAKPFDDQAARRVFYGTMEERGMRLGKFSKEELRSHLMVPDKVFRMSARRMGYDVADEARFNAEMRALRRDMGMYYVGLRDREEYEKKRIADLNRDIHREAGIISAVNSAELQEKSARALAESRENMRRTLPERLANEAKERTEEEKAKRRKRIEDAHDQSIYR